MLATRITKAIGGNTDLHTSQSFIFQGATEESEQIILIVLLSGSGEDIFTKIRNLGFSTEQHFFSLELPLTERLQKTMHYLQTETTEITQQNILVAVLKDEALYLLSAGNDQVILHRENKTTILTRQGDNQLVSGFLQPGDKVLFISPRFAPQDTEQTKWDDYFLQRLLLSDQEIIEEEIENYLQQLGQPEPIATVVLSTKSHLEQNNDQPFDPNPVREELLYATEQENEQAPMPHLTEPISFDHPKSKRTLPKLKLPTISPRIKREVYRILFPLTFKKLGIIAAILLVIIIFISIYAYQLNQKTQKQNQLTQSLTLVRQNITQAQQTQESNREAAKQYLQSAKNALQTAQGIEPENNQVKELTNQLNQLEGSIFKSIPLTNWQTYLSLDLIRPGFNAKKMSFNVGKLLLLDPNQKSLVQIEIETKNNQLIAGETQLGNAQFASLNGDYAFVYSSNKGLLRVETNNRQITTVSAPDSEWGEIKSLFGFSSNVYLLDGKNNQIWKYVPTKDSYSDKQIYLQDNQSLDFSNAKQLFIDYSVWVVKETPEIIRFTAGNRDFYSIGGLDTPLSQVEAIFAPEEQDIVFILEPKNKRVITTKKNGEYLSQYTSEIFATATDIIFDEESKTLYVLENNKIQQTTLP